MRIVLAEYINENKDKIYNTESQIQIGILLPSDYIYDNRFDFEGFFDDFLLNMHNEAEKIIIYLSPIIFEVDLKLYILEGAASLHPEKLHFHKQDFPCLLSNNSINNTGPSRKISLFYRFSHYDKFYTKEMLNHNDKYLHSYIIPSFEEEEGLAVNYVKVVGELDCEECKSLKAEVIEFAHIKYFSICKVCLIKYIYKIMINRVKFFISENFNNRECNNNNYNI